MVFRVKDRVNSDSCLCVANKTSIFRSFYYWSRITCRNMWNEYKGGSTIDSRLATYCRAKYRSRSFVTAKYFGRIQSYAGGWRFPSEK